MLELDNCMTYIPRRSANQQKPLGSRQRIWKMNMPETSNAEDRPTASAGMSWPAIFAAINVIALILGFV